jgi:hypothetical protein
MPSSGVLQVHEDVAKPNLPVTKYPSEYLGTPVFYANKEKADNILPVKNSLLGQRASRLYNEGVVRKYFILAPTLQSLETNHRTPASVKAYRAIIVGDLPRIVRSGSVASGDLLVLPAAVAQFIDAGDQEGSGQVNFPMTASLNVPMLMSSRNRSRDVPQRENLTVDDFKFDMDEANQELKKRNIPITLTDNDKVPLAMILGGFLGMLAFYNL